MERELISVVIPVYNDYNTLPKTLGSVLKQTHQNFEILVIDDGSEVDIEPIIYRFEDKRISYHKLIQHQNANVARNEGINRSKGKYIAMLDADDLWLENHLEDSLNQLMHAESDGIYGSIILRNGNSDQVKYARNLTKGETMISYLLKTGYGAQTSSLFVTAESARNIMWDPTLRRHQDYDFVVRYSKTWIIIAKVNPTVVYVTSSKKRDIDFHSCISFIKKNKVDIEPFVYTNYHINMYALSKSFQVRQDVSHYLKYESMSPLRQALLPIN